MYTGYYNLKLKPFQISSDPAFLWLGEKHREALATLKYGILDNRGFLLLTGDVGTGKTTVVNALLNDLDETVIRAVVPDPNLERLDFYNFIASGFGMDQEFAGKGAFLKGFSQFLNKANSDQKKVLLIIDEAQLLTQALLEEIRLLSNIETAQTKLVTIFFVGQNEFNEILTQPQNRAVRQRITINYNIPTLTPEETAAYVRHRLKVAGTSAAIFDEGALHEIYQCSQGFPRRINVICDHALLTGYVKEMGTINATIIRDCAREISIPGKVMKKDFDTVPYLRPAVSKSPAVSKPVKAPPGNSATKPMNVGPIDNEVTKPVTAGIQGNVVTKSVNAGLQAPKMEKDSGSKKKSTLPWLRSGIIFLFLAGLAALYFFYHDLFIPSTISEAGKPVRTAVSDSGQPGNDATPAVTPTPDEMHPSIQSVTAGVSDQEYQVIGANPEVGKTVLPAEQSMALNDRNGSMQPLRPILSEIDPPGTGAAPDAEPVQDLSKGKSDISPSAGADPGSGKNEGGNTGPALSDHPYTTEGQITTIRFNSSTSELAPEDDALLDELAGKLKQNPALHIIVRGFSDSSGFYSQNQVLSEQRAGIVKELLINKGIISQRIIAMGLGSTNPVASNETLLGRKMNRRVEIEIVRE
ncbi:MAG: AAA family ATPase [Pseudomonadota bacterium]